MAGPRLTYVTRTPTLPMRCSVSELIARWVMEHGKSVVIVTDIDIEHNRHPDISTLERCGFVDVCLDYKTLHVSARINEKGLEYLANNP